MIKYVLISVIAVTVLGFTGIMIRNQLVFMRQGWKVIGVGRDAIAYVERGKGRITFSVELMGSGPINRVIIIPGSSWNSAFPAWTHGRRDEILGRLKLELPESRNEYRLES